MKYIDRHELIYVSRKDFQIKHLEHRIELWCAPYFPKKEHLRDELQKNMKKDCIYVDKSEESGIVQGVIWYQREGLFHAFPYLHMIAVRSDCRNGGVGTRLMDFFEQDSLTAGSNRMRIKAFLLVSDHNHNAQRFYQSRGYEEIGCFESLFRKGVTERLLMKKVTVKK